MEGKDVETYLLNESYSSVTKKKHIQLILIENHFRRKKSFPIKYTNHQFSELGITFILMSIVFNKNFEQCRV